MRLYIYIGTHQHKTSGIKACLGAIHVQFYMIFSYFTYTYIFKNRRYFGPLSLSRSQEDVDEEEDEEEGNMKEKNGKLVNIIRRSI